MATKFNMSNKGHEKGYPLFLGESLGIVDTINIQYPQLEDLYVKQMSQIWNEFEIDLSQDKMDMKNVSQDTKDLMVKTIMWQTSADSSASRSIVELLGKYVTNSELLNMITAQTLFEVIHARSYSHIIKQTFPDPSKMINDIYNEQGVMDRLSPIIKAFDEMERLTGCDDEKAIRQGIIKTLVALLALEAISFMSSFAVTFALTETGVFQGIGQIVTLIAKDEVLHTRMDYEVLNILKSDPQYKMDLAFLSEDIKEILDCVVEQEKVWSDYLFSGGRQVIGLNAPLLKEYVYHMAKPVYDALGVEYDFPLVEENPLPYMDKYIDSSLQFPAPQEIQLVNYKIGSIKDDTDSLDLTDFDY